MQFGEGITRELAEERKVPVVSVTSSLPPLPFPTVRSDHQAIARLAIDHFRHLGLRHIAYVGASYPSGFSRARGDAFERIAVEQGFSCPRSDTSVVGQPVVAEERLSLAAFLQKLPKPCGVFACNDRRALEVILACRQADLRIPENIAVLGVDNDDLIVMLSDPPLSSIDLQPERIGYEAGMLLQRLMDGEEVSSEPTTVPPRGVLARQSTAVLSINDPDIAAAVQFISDHADSPIGVKQVQAHVLLSRRSLYRRFERALGRSPADQIRLAHVERARHLLASTTWTMAEIARASGFSSATRLGIAFKSVTGLTPTQFRQHGRKPA